MDREELEQKIEEQIKRNDELRMEIEKLEKEIVMRKSAIIKAKRLVDKMKK